MKDAVELKLSRRLLFSDSRTLQQSSPRDAAVPDRRFQSTAWRAG